MSTTPEGPKNYGAPQSATPLSPSDEKLWATLAHAGAIFLYVLAPLIVWLMYKDKSAFVEDQAKESLNFQILVTIAVTVSWALAGATGFILGFIPVIIGLANLVLCIMAAMAANKGEAYRYPFNWRIVK
jgi:uncharacterized protein